MKWLTLNPQKGYCYYLNSNWFNQVVVYLIKKQSLQFHTQRMLKEFCKDESKMDKMTYSGACMAINNKSAITHAISSRYDKVRDMINFLLEVSKYLLALLMFNILHQHIT